MPVALTLPRPALPAPETWPIPAGAGPAGRRGASAVRPPSAAARHTGASAQRQETGGQETGGPETGGQDTRRAESGGLESAGPETGGPETWHTNWQESFQDSWAPRRFCDRGVLLPVTTPALFGARLRASPGGLELIIPNPAGGRGVYILPLAAVRAFCAPSLHDRALLRAVSGLGVVTPAAMRQAARRVAITGLAGQAAADAAGRALAREDQARRLMELRLLCRLPGMADHDLALKGALADAAAPSSTQDAATGLAPHQTALACRLRQAGEAALAALAPCLGRPAAALADQLAALAAYLAPCGLGDEPAGARLGLLAAQLAGLAAAPPHAPLAECAPPASPGGDIAATALLARAAALTASLAEAAMRDARRLALDVPALLAGGLPGENGRDPGSYHRLNAADWLQEGWEPICLLHRLAPDGGGGRAAALAEMTRLLPPLPQEAGREEDAAALERMRAQLPPIPSRAAPAALIWRYEQLRVLAA